MNINEDKKKRKERLLLKRHSVSARIFSAPTSPPALSKFAVTSRSTQAIKVKAKTKERSKAQVIQRVQSTQRAETRILQRRSSVTFGSPPKPLDAFEATYTLGTLIGEGITSRVYIATHNNSKKDVAVKLIPMARIRAHTDLVREIRILKQLEHPHIIKLLDVFITPLTLTIVMELAEGMELFEEIVNRRNFTELDAKNIIKKLLHAVDYLHDQGIAHRDIKPENIIFIQQEGKNDEIKLVDFGFAQYCDMVNPFKNPAGTLGYKAPEVFRGSYTLKADIWSVGVVSYILLCGFPPFFSCQDYKDVNMLCNAPFWFFFNEETDQLLQEIQSGTIHFPSPFWDNISSDARNFVSSLLVVDPENRTSAKQALCHAWITEETPIHHKGLKTRKIMNKYNSATKNIKEKLVPARTTQDIVEEHLFMLGGNQEKTAVLKRLRESSVLRKQERRLLHNIDQEKLNQYLKSRKNSLSSLLDLVRQYSSKNTVVQKRRQSF